MFGSVVRRASSVLAIQVWTWLAALRSVGQCALDAVTRKRTRGGTVKSQEVQHSLRAAALASADEAVHASPALAQSDVFWDPEMGGPPLAPGDEAVDGMDEDSENEQVCGVITGVKSDPRQL